MKRTFSAYFVVSVAVIAVAFGDRLQCKDPNGQSIDWFTAIKLPNLKSNLSDGTIYIYMDAKNPEWTYATGITTEESAVGHTVAQMYANSQSYNEVSGAIIGSVGCAIHRGPRFLGAPISEISYMIFLL